MVESRGDGSGVSWSEAVSVDDDAGFLSPRIDPDANTPRSKAAQVSKLHDLYQKIAAELQARCVLSTMAGGGCEVTAPSLHLQCRTIAGRVDRWC
jgi:hypothetical protein